MSERIRNLNNGKANGIDDIKNEYLKNLPPSFIDIVTRFFNVILESGHVPEIWCTGIIVPLYKGKGDRDNADNFRGITLLSCLGKLFTSTINTRLSKFIELAGVMGEEQAGFRSGYSTEDHIFTLHMLIEHYKEQEKRLYCAFVDYRKAFDYVHRPSLWRKVINSGISGRILRAVVDIYNQAKSALRSYPDAFRCNVGVRQGENLSPLLFALYLNDFENYLKDRYNGLACFTNDFVNNANDEEIQFFHHLYILLYADDTIILSESAEELQRALDALRDYCQEWNLTVNLDKTKVMIFSRGLVRVYPDFWYGPCKVEVVKEYTYLGVVFSYDGSFSKAIAKQLEQASKAQNSLLWRAKKLKLPTDVVLDLWDKLVLTVLLYGSEIWGWANLEPLETFHRKFLKKVLGLRANVSNCMVYGETGARSISDRAAERMVGFWAKLVKGKKSKIAYSSYLLSKRKHLSPEGLYVSRWMFTVQTELEKVGLIHAWHSDADGLSYATVKNSSKRRRPILASELWKQELRQHVSCQQYRRFKKEFVCEKYLINACYKDKMVLARFRCRSSYIPIAALDRYWDPFFDSTCPLCHAVEDGDEEHYLLNCTHFLDERLNLIGHIIEEAQGNFGRIMAMDELSRRDLGRMARFLGGVMDTLKEHHNLDDTLGYGLDLLF